VARALPGFTKLRWEVPANAAEEAEDGRNSGDIGDAEAVGTTEGAEVAAQSD
jgi:hypothetical protein